MIDRQYTTKVFIRFACMRVGMACSTRHQTNFWLLQISRKCKIGLNFLICQKMLGPKNSMYIFIWQHFPSIFWGKTASSRQSPMGLTGIRVRSRPFTFAPTRVRPLSLSHPTSSRQILIGFVFNNFVIKFWQVVFL